jgi:hypothetical protein
VPTRTAIAGKLAKERAALLAHYQGLSDAELTGPCTDSEHDGGRPWAAKDHLAHIANIERTFQGIIERTLAGERAPVGIGGKGASIEELMATVHRMNEAHVDANRSTPLDGLLADIAAARADSLALLDRVSDEDLARPVPGAPWADGTIGGVLITLGYHDQQHMTWVTEGLASQSS